MFGWMVGEELTELLTKPLTGRKTADNTKIMHFSQYLSIDTLIFCNSTFPYRSQATLQSETGPWLLENRSHPWATCGGTVYSWSLWANIRKTAVASSFCPNSPTLQFKNCHQGDSRERCSQWVGELRGGRWWDRRHTVMVGSAVFCVAFAMLFGGARIAHLVPQGDVT